MTMLGAVGRWQNAPHASKSRDVYIGWRIYRKIPDDTKDVVFSNLKSASSLRLGLALPLRFNSNQPATTRKMLASMRIDDKYFGALNTSEGQIG